MCNNSIKCIIIQIKVQSSNGSLVISLKVLCRSDLNSYVDRIWTLMSVESELLCRSDLSSYVGRISTPMSVGSALNYYVGLIWTLAVLIWTLVVLIWTLVVGGTKNWLKLARLPRGRRRMPNIVSCWRWPEAVGFHRIW